MAVEIERKFLVNKELWQPSGPGVKIRQGYLSLEPERTVRVRTKGEKAYLTIKGKNKGLSRLELEYEIPVAEAEQLLDELCLRPLIEKNRYLEEFQGKIWEIDEFFGDNAGLLVAEVELDKEDAEVATPEWIAAEVSGDSRYYNSSLIQHPYTKWQS